MCHYLPSSLQKPWVPRPAGPPTAPASRGECLAGLPGARHPQEPEGGQRALPATDKLWSLMLMSCGKSHGQDICLLSTSQPFGFCRSLLAYLLTCLSSNLLASSCVSSRVERWMFEQWTCVFDLCYFKLPNLLGLMTSYFLGVWNTWPYRVVFLSALCHSVGPWSVLPRQYFLSSESQQWAAGDCPKVECGAKTRSFHVNDL